MLDRSLLRRVTALAYLLLAVTLTGVVPAAEARTFAATPSSHVEAPNDDRSCPPVHDHWDCNVCRALRLMARGENGPALEFLTAAPPAPRLLFDDGLVLNRLGSAWRSRAPPAL